VRAISGKGSALRSTPADGKETAAFTVETSANSIYMMEKRAIHADSPFAV